MRSKPWSSADCKALSCRHRTASVKLMIHHEVSHTPVACVSKAYEAEISCSAQEHLSGQHHH